MTTENEKAEAFPVDAPEKASAMTKAIWPEGAKALAGLEKAVEAAKAVQGSMGEFTTKAKAEVMSLKAIEVASFVPDMALGDFLAGIEQAVGETVSKLTGDLGPKRTAAEEAYKAAEADWTSFLNFALKDKAAASVVKAVAVPQLPSKRTARTDTKASAVNTSGLVYWRQPEGKDKTPQGASQNKVSSLAYYYCGPLDGKDNGNIDSLRSHGKTHGVDVDSTTESWSLPIPGFGTIGLDVPVKDEAPAEEDAS